MKLFKKFSSKINWYDHIIHFFIVLISITLAFNLESYRQNVKNKKEEKEILVSIAEEIQQDTLFINAEIRYNKHTKIEFLKLDKLVQKSDTINIKTYNEIGIKLNEEIKFTPYDITYSSILNSGKLNIISNRKLRNKIISLYNRTYRNIYQYKKYLSRKIMHLNNMYKNSIYIDNKHNLLKPKKMFFSNFITQFVNFLQNKEVYYKDIQNQCIDLLVEIKEELTK